MKKIIVRIVFSFLLIAIAVSCTKSHTVNKYPSCVQNIINDNKNVYSIIYQYTYNGQIVYKFDPTSNSNDVPTTYVDINCNELCSIGGWSQHNEALYNDIEKYKTNKIVILKR